MFEKRLLLDTCALLWLVSGSERLSQRARDSIKRATVVYVSAVSAWEISLKVAQDALSLPRSPEEWFPLALDKHSLVLANLSVEVLCSANRLPFHHRDPADRFIIATAQLKKAAVVISDKRFSLYGIPLIG